MAVCNSSTTSLSVLRPVRRWMRTAIDWLPVPVSISITFQSRSESPVATAMGLSDRDWKVIDIETGTGSQSIAVRIQRLTGLSTERLVVLELQTAIPTARSVAIRLSPLMPEDHLVTVAYPDRQPRSVSGRFVQYGAEGRLAGAALLEMYEGNDRLAVDH